MSEPLNLNAFQEYINKGKTDFAFDIIINKSIELIKQIATMKGLSLEDLKSIEDREDLFYYFEKLFEENCAYFQAIPALMRNFTTWYTELIDIYEPTCEEKIEMYINNYNLILYELEEYEKIKKEIQEKGYENLKNEKIQKLIPVFKEMLDFKHKNYNEKWSFKDWIEAMDKYYHFYHENFESTLSQIQRNILCRNIYMDYQVYIDTDEVENIIALDDLYDIIDKMSINKKPIVQSMKNFMDNSNDKNIFNTSFSMPDVVEANINDYIPKETLLALKNFILKIDKILPGFADDKNTIYAPSFEMGWKKFILNDDFQTNVNGIYIIGDATGHFRGAMQAMASGILCANSLLKEDKKVLKR